MIVQGTGLDTTGRHTIGVVLENNCWWVAIDDVPVGPPFLYQHPAEQVSLWLRLATEDIAAAFRARGVVSP